MPPPKKPLEVKELEGNRSRVDLTTQLENEKRVRRLPNVPEAPPSLRKIGREKWYFLFPHIQLWLKTVDLDTLEAYCQAFESYRAAARRVNDDGITIETARGGTVKNPAVTAMFDAMNAMMKYSNALGLNPGARAKIFESFDKGDNKGDKWDNIIEH
jgi:P27 family predicted phage terminase small subunit